MIVGDLFAGVGGMSEGFKMAGDFRIAFAVDVDWGAKLLFLPLFQEKDNNLFEVPDFFCNFVPDFWMLVRKHHVLEFVVDVQPS